MNMKYPLSISIVIIFGLQVIACHKSDLDIPELEDKSDYIAIFGDIQYYTNSSYIDLYKHSIDWILNQHNKGVDIKCVLHTGDITQSNSVSEWKCFESAMLKLPHVIPYYSMIGDHDYTWYDGVHINDRNNTLFNSFIQYRLSKKNVLEQFESGHMENAVIKNTIQGQRLDLLILEFGPREEVVSWADAYVKAHSDIKFILLTHEYLEMGGGRRKTGLKSVRRLQNTTYVTPEQLWERLIKCNDNIICTLCGHVGGLYAVTLDVNDNGHEIPQIQHNIQSVDYRYDNWLMMWEFPVHSDSASISIVNTRTGSYYNDTPVLFKFKYRE